MYASRDTKELKTAFEEARCFVEPLANTNEAESELPVGAVPQAQRILIVLHKLLEDERTQKASFGEAIDAYDNFRVKTVTTLLEFIATYGLLPWLPAETSEIKSMKYVSQSSNKLSEKDWDNSDRISLGELLPPLLQIATETGKGVEPMVRDSILPIITCAAAFSLNPGSFAYLQGQSRFNTFHDFAESLPMIILLPLLTSLVRSIKTPQIHDECATELSVLPLRPHGVQHIIEFIASSLVPASAARGNEQNLHDQVQEIPMSLEALQQASRLLSSVPESLGARTYFEHIVPQLLALLDGSYGPTMSTAAAYIIGTGVLGKRSTGAPGTIGWELFAMPLINSLNPGLNRRVDGSFGTPDLDRVSLGNVLVSSDELDLAVSRISKILLSHPNPGLTKRLLRSSLLSLWGLAGSNEESSKDNSVVSTAWKILETYVRLYASTEQIDEIAKHLLFDGTLYWVFTVGGDRRFEIHRRAVSQQGELGLLEKMIELNRRAGLFVKLLSVCNIQSNVVCTIFLGAVKNWLSLKDLAPSASLGGVQSPEDVLLPLVNLRLAMELISSFKDELASQPLQVMQIVDWLLADVVKALNSDVKGDSGVFKKPSLGLLGQISQSANKENARNKSDAVSDESTIIAALAISLLDAALKTPDMELGADEEQHMKSIRASTRILKQRNYSLPLSLTTAVTGLETHIEKILRGENQATLASAQTESTSSNHTTSSYNQIEDDRKLYAEALQNISSPQPPIRVEGLSSLSALINASSPAVDVAALTVLLLSVLSEDDATASKSQPPRSSNQTDPQEADDYVVLGTLHTLTQLAEYEPRIVMPLLLETYLNRSSSHSLDVRLRVAEGLGSIINAFTSHSPKNKDSTTREQFIVQIGEAAIIISSRRGRPQPSITNNTHDPHPASEPSFQHAGLESNEDPNTEDETLRRIVESWGLSPHNEEDLRLRASALSLLSQILAQAALSLLGASTLLGSIIEIACAVLHLERGPENAIARRAASLVLLQFVRAMDRIFEEGGEGALLGVGLDVDGALERIGAIMGDLVSQDEDELVRGHAGATLEEMEAWRVKRVVGISEAGGPEVAGMTSELELKALKGLNVNDDKKDQNGTNKPLLIEEIDD